MKYTSLLVTFAILLLANTAEALERVRPIYDNDTGTTPDSTSTITQKREALQAELKANLEMKKKAMEEAKKTTKSEMMDLKYQAKEKMEAFKAKIEEMKDKKKQERAKNLLVTRMKAFEGFTRVLDNVTKTKDRVKEKITQAKTLGVDVSVAESNIVTVEATLTDAKDKILKIATLLASKTDKLTEAEKKELKDLGTAIQQDFKKARMLLNDTVKLLKDSLKDYKENLKAGIQNAN